MTEKLLKLEVDFRGQGKQKLAIFQRECDGRMGGLVVVNTPPDEPILQNFAHLVQFDEGDILYQGGYFAESDRFKWVKARPTPAGVELVIGEQADWIIYRTTPYWQEIEPAEKIFQEVLPEIAR